MAKFEQTVLKLKEGHTWRCKPGYKIFVLGQGALRFDVPRDWIVQPDERSVKLYDRQPPDDNCRLEVSLMRHSQIDWTGLPLDQLILGVIADKPGETPGETTPEIRRQSRPGVELVWVEKAFIDPQLGNPARSRIAVVRGTNAHGVITLDFWEADAGRVVPVWDEVMRSMDLGLQVPDPTLGERPM
jgi:hypothetical protein